ncbi:MAG TPA: DNA primase [Thermoanaerobaculales bacterium]|nr:DNA primase [Thermoanaerobaculales bacterium]HQN96706.1 DNA primase [Thermoanaerobaculales bacterium]
MAIDIDLSRDSVARVREAADIVEVVGEQVRLRRRGRTLEGLCPFHEEKTPSFSVDPDKGLYYCFGCHQGGDIFKFVMQTARLSFAEAVEQLARRYGVKLPPRSPDGERRRQESDRLRTLLEEAQAFFVARLAGTDGAAARRELERRGFGPATWPEFGFGWAPDDWRQLTDELGRRHPAGTLIAAGLAVQPDSRSSPYDRFRKRITFPIRSVDGRLIAFGGRILGEGEPKYLNSPENPLFQKRSTLFCLDRARKPADEVGELLVVEGYFDCLSLHRVGITNTVATLGTALTPDHARLLRRRLGEGERVVLCYDADEAGRRAAMTGIRVLLEAGVDVAVLVLPDGTDPDDAVRSGGAAAVRELLQRPASALEFLLAGLPDQPEALRREGIKLAPLVCAARNPATRQNLIEELARRLYLRPRDIEEHGRAAARREGPSSSRRDAARRPAAPGERHLARTLLECPPAWRARIVELVRPDLLSDDRVRSLLEAAIELAPGLEPADAVRELLGRCADEGVTSFVAELCNSDWPELTDASIRSQLRALLDRQGRELARRLAPRIRAAEERGDHQELELLLAEKARLRQKSAEF